MRALLVQGAMDIEIDTLIERVSAVKDTEIGGFTFYKGFLDGYPIIISKTNIGIANSAAATAMGILKYDPCAVINQGSAGAHRGDLNVNDIIIGEICKNINSFEKPFLETGTDYKNWIHTDFRELEEDVTPLKADEKLVSLFKSFKYKKGKKHVGVLGSGDVWNKEKEFITWLHENLGTYSEDMETTAVYKIAQEFSVPVIGIRIISNNELNKASFDRNTAINLQNYIYENLITIAKKMQY